MTSNNQNTHLQYLLQKAYGYPYTVTQQGLPIGEGENQSALRNYSQKPGQSHGFWISLKNKVSKKKVSKKKVHPINGGRRSTKRVKRRRSTKRL